MITPDTVVVGVDPEDMSEDAFIGVLEGARSPALFEAKAGYEMLTLYDVSIAFCLAIFHHESQYGHAGITPKYNTKNPGNCRSKRGVDGVVISTEKGPFVRYDNWPDGWSDLAWRLVDPEYVYVKENRRTIREIITRFAPASDGNSPEHYINAVVADMNRWVGVTKPMTAQIPGFTWHPANSTHYDRGRSQQIRGGAQHYSAGTNSLDWLTKTSGATDPDKRVSATFLVKHTPTLDDRGWQLVRIEDTAWTTAFANPYTVSIEYEHKAGQPIPDIAYEVLALTWLDIDRYCREHGLGAIASILGHKEWVGNPSLICPDGIDITRIQQRFQELKQPPPPPADDGNPWFLHLGDGKYADFAYRRGFRGVVEGLAIQRFPADPNSAALALFGPPEEEEWEAVDGRTFQRTRKGTLVYTPGVAVPWDVAKLDHDEPLPERKTP